MKLMDDSKFDVLILGTGLAESIAAAALAKAGYKVAHIDHHQYYGGDEASLSLDELVQWVDSHCIGNTDNARYSFVTRSASVPLQSRQYSICLTPTVLPSLGPLISSLVASGVAKYTGFRLLDSLSVYDAASGSVKPVPDSKEAVFKNKEISLVEKRRLMRFLTFAAGDFEGAEELVGKTNEPFSLFLKSAFHLNETMADVIAYSLAFCVSSGDPTLPALNRLRRYLRSMGRYGPSPFLIGHYGGIGDIAQGFCRAAAVSGAVYILGRSTTITSVDSHTQSGDPSESSDPIPHCSRYSISLSDFPDSLSCSLVISSSSYVPSHLVKDALQLPPLPQFDTGKRVGAIARCIAIIDKAISFLPRADPPTEDVYETNLDSMDEDSEPVQTKQNIDTSLLVFPPSSLAGGSETSAATIFITGEGTMSAPTGKWVLYISLPILSPAPSQSAQGMLRPYLDAVLGLPKDTADAPIQPIFTTFYVERPAQHPLGTGEFQYNAVSDPVPKYIIMPPLPLSPLSDIGDIASAHAEVAFKEAVRILKELRNAAGTENTEKGDVEQMWPPLEVEDEITDW